MWPFQQPKSIKSLKTSIPRDELIRSSRMLIIDDEEPTLKRDLESRGFAVTWVADMEQNTQHQIENGLYDLILLDFAGVGQTMGVDEGLAILRHIKRVAPAVIVLSYTSKSLGSSQADFYRLTDGVLPKDTGIAESLEKVEQALRQANSPENLWKALVSKMDITTGSQQEVELQRRMFGSTGNLKKKQQFIDYVSSTLENKDTKKAAATIAGKLLLLAASSL